MNYSLDYLEKIEHYIKSNKYLILLLGWLLALFGHYYLVPYARIPILTALADPFTHGMITLLMVFGLYARSVIKLPTLLICCCVGVLIDIDHGIAAMSFHIKDWLVLTERPLSHSLLFALGAGVVFGLFHKKNRWVVAYAMSMCLASHVLRDATDVGHTPWNYPFPYIRFNVYIYFSLMIGVSYLQTWGFTLEDKWRRVKG